MKIAEALDLFLTQLQADGRSEHTIRQYRRHVRALERWLAPRDSVGEITHLDIARFFASPAARQRPDGSQKRATSTNALRTSLRCFFGYLHQAGLISVNPARLLRRAICSPPPPRALSDGEARRLVDVIDHHRDRMLTRFMLGTGLRVGSAVAVALEDVDLDHGEVAVRRAKGDRPDRVFLPRSLAEDLRGWLAGRGTGPLFPARGGGHLSVRQVQHRLGGWFRLAGVRGSPHTCRHTFATQVYRRTGDILLVQRALRHASISSTLVYASADHVAVSRALDNA